MPDANHNWNSLLLEEVTVGQTALLKLPRPRSEVTTPLTGINQEHRLVEIVYVEPKNSSILVRYRL